MPIILITGSNGQVGWELQRSVSHLGKVISLNRQEMNLSDPDQVKSVIREINPDIIINAAAYTAVDRAEEELEQAYQINSITPGIMAEEAKNLGALLLHYSTDYVFDGLKSSPYIESDQTNPLNVYGASKLAGEKAIQDAGCDYLIFRTSWVFSPRSHNFVLSMLKLAGERTELNIVADQTGSPTSARLIAELTANILWQTINQRKNNKFTSDLYHMTSGGVTSWHGFATKIIELARIELIDKKISVKNILPIKTEAYPTPAKRPVNSCLATEKLESSYGVYLPDWSEQLELCIKELNNKI